MCEQRPSTGPDGQRAQARPDFPAQLPSLERTSLRGEATRVIRAQIASGALSPDQLYVIGDIARQFGVSSTPVREALIDLQNQGLVEIVRNRGFRVRALEDQDLNQIVEIRLLLEVPIIGQLASLSPPPNLDALRPVTRDIESAAAYGDLVKFLSLDRDFHLELLSLHNNPRLVEIVEGLRDQTRLLGLWEIVGTDDLVASAMEHDLILDAISAGDARQAQLLMRRHLEHVRGLWAGQGEDPEE